MNCGCRVFFMSWGGSPCKIVIYTGPSHIPVKGKKWKDMGRRGKAARHGSKTARFAHTELNVDRLLDAADSCWPINLGCSKDSLGWSPCLGCSVYIKFYWPCTAYIVYCNLFPIHVIMPVSIDYFGSDRHLFETKTHQTSPLFRPEMHLDFETAAGSLLTLASIGSGAQNEKVLEFTPLKS